MHIFKISFVRFFFPDFDDPEDVEKFIREGVMMRGLDHKHVLSLIGVCLDSDVERCLASPLIVLPFMKNGDLRTFLRDGNNVSFALDVVFLSKALPRPSMFRIIVTLA